MRASEQKTLSEKLKAVFARAKKALSDRHDYADERACYALACDEEASCHYGIEMSQMERGLRDCQVYFPTYIGHFFKRRPSQV
jgi:hypothetical protein